VLVRLRSSSGVLGAGVMAAFWNRSRTSGIARAWPIALLRIAT
jgi:hypothetical protein